MRIAFISSPSVVSVARASLLGSDLKWMAKHAIEISPRHLQEWHIRLSSTEVEILLMSHQRASFPGKMLQSAIRCMTPPRPCLQTTWSLPRRHEPMLTATRSLLQGSLRFPKLRRATFSSSKVDVILKHICQQGPITTLRYSRTSNPPSKWLSAWEKTSKLVVQTLSHCKLWRGLRKLSRISTRLMRQIKSSSLQLSS